MGRKRHDQNFAGLRLDCISLLAGETRKGTAAERAASGVLREPLYWVGNTLSLTTLGFQHIYGEPAASSHRWWPLVHGHRTIHRHYRRLAYA